MTVIAWDGSVLAADRRLVIGGVVAETTKIRRAGKFLVGGAGPTVEVAYLLEWAGHDFDLDQHPEKLYGVKISDETALVAVTDSVGGPRVVVYEGGGRLPAVVKSPFFALGSGEKFASAAMYLGHNAEYAVSVANALCPWCGNGCDMLRLRS